LNDGRAVALYSCARIGLCCSTICLTRDSRSSFRPCRMGIIPLAGPFSLIAIHKSRDGCRTSLRRPRHTAGSGGTFGIFPLIALYTWAFEQWRYRATSSAVMISAGKCVSDRSSGIASFPAAVKFMVKHLSISGNENANGQGSFHSGFVGPFPPRGRRRESCEGELPEQVSFCPPTRTCPFHCPLIVLAAVVAESGQPRSATLADENVPLHVLSLLLRNVAASR
jgi:hypothetical protein